MKPLSALSCLLALPLSAAPPLAFDNLPFGSAQQPLVLRTYLPDPGIDDAVFSQHDTGRPVSKYNPALGADVPGEVKPIPAITAAIAVNFGPALSFAFDTTEARLLYAWQGGFLDMTPYWGDVERGSRLSMDYVPRLVGTLFHQTEGKHPVELGGKSLTDLGPRVYTGYLLKDGVPSFEFSAADHQFTLTLKPSTTQLSLDATLTCKPAAPIAWRGVEGATGNGSISFTLTGSELGTFQGYKRDLKITEASTSVGETLFGTYGCAACHSIDGSASHGPSVGGLYGREVHIEGLDKPIIAGTAYLLESIKNPNAKVVKGYPPNYMPPFGLPDVEYDSLILYIQSLATPE